MINVNTITEYIIYYPFTFIEVLLQGHGGWYEVGYIYKRDNLITWLITWPIFWFILIPIAILFGMGYFIASKIHQLIKTVVTKII